MRRCGWANRQTVAEVPATPWVGRARAGAARPQRSWPERDPDDSARPPGPPRWPPAAPSILDRRGVAPNVTLAARNGPNPAARHQRRCDLTPRATSGRASTCWPSNGRIRSYRKGYRRRRRRSSTPPPTTFFLRRCATAPPTGKPRVRYDRKAGRWIVSMITRGAAQPRPAGGERHARRSSGGDHAGASSSGPTPAPPGGLGGGASCLGDDPTLGLDDDAYYIGVNQRCGADARRRRASIRPRLYVVRRSSMLTGSARWSCRSSTGCVADAGRRRHLRAAGRRSTSTPDPTYGYVIGVDNAAEGPPGAAPRSANAGAIARACRPTSSITQEIDPTGDPISGAAPGRRGAARRARRPAGRRRSIRNGRLWTVAPLRGGHPRRGRPRPAAATASAGTS